MSGWIWVLVFILLVSVYSVNGISVARFSLVHLRNILFIMKEDKSLYEAKISAFMNMYGSVKVGGGQRFWKGLGKESARWGWIAHTHRDCHIH
jgi:hypothetical protein